MKWITREHPKIDRIACPWLIKRFIDPEATFLYVPAGEVVEKSIHYQAIPYDVQGVEYTHYGDQCTFDYILKKHGIKDPALNTMAGIVRGADTDRHEIAQEASGLWAISAGLAHNINDDHELLERGMMLYDALYSWAKYLQKEKHTTNPSEKLLLGVYHQLLKKSSTKKIPGWAKEVKELIQDHLDTSLTLSLKEISQNLKVHPAYLSREFSKYFDDLSFGDYIRKLRIEKAIDLMKSTSYSLTEISYLTGFSDQSHFSRTFQKITGEKPSVFRKNQPKVK